ncbi:hypothetical protein Franean1_6743 [Parafrankia sp. EAN1pec]|uniref:hypothetical protein n=1 Tax=Parafrankia sp. (strain EAN1pec) TaxID=298653 RepID=UPI0000541DBA|nr:hypothetical protein Franean1_6743 [Frankia sp. EAN1pec]
MPSVPNRPVTATLNPDGTFTVTLTPAAPRNTVINGLLDVPDSTDYAQARPAPDGATGLLFVPRGATPTAPATGWTPPLPAPPAGSGEAEPVGEAVRVLLTALVLDDPALTGITELSAVHDLLRQRLRRHRERSRWRTPRPPA